jgi:hypothetical protein
MFYPISIYDNLKEALDIMKTASLSVRPYQQEWYTNVFLPAFEELSPEPNYKISEYVHIIAKENVVGLTTKQLADIMNKHGMNSLISSLYENYLRRLAKQGITNYGKSVLNGKEIYTILILLATNLIYPYLYFLLRKILILYQQIL